MKVEVNGDIVKAIRKLSKMKFISGTSSSEVKKSKIFQKKTTLRRQRVLAKILKISEFKKQNSFNYRKQAAILK